MKIYLVGGAVRDQLLSLPFTDKDWLVVGATPEVLLEKKYQAVGKDFPVFLHPKTKEAYALARTERKKGSGYTGFDCYFAADVTLEQDLKRRDLTINAMAYDPITQTIIDPYGGQTDLANRDLRHVSGAFSEDPLRILRTARFAARFHTLGFKVHPTTNTLMKKMVHAGELLTLSPERVWQELARALSSPSPHIFLQVLRQCGALKQIFPEINALYGVPANTYWHPEIDSGIHLEMALKAVAELTFDLAVRFAVLVHDLGKGCTPRQDWPHHPRHADDGLKPIQIFCQRWHIPKKIALLAEKVCVHHTTLHKIIDKPSAEKTLLLLEKLNAFKYPTLLMQFCLACEADHQGRLSENKPYTQKDFILDAHSKTAKIDMENILKTHKTGPEIKEALYAVRLEKLSEFI